MEKLKQTFILPSMLSLLFLQGQLLAETEGNIIDILQKTNDKTAFEFATRLRNDVAVIVFVRSVDW